MPTSLSRRVCALEADTPVYRSVTDIPDAALEALLTPLCDGRTPTNEDLVRISLTNQTEQQHAKP